jgi:hypothetical protein
MTSARTALPRRTRRLLAPRASARILRSSYSQLARSLEPMVHPNHAVLRPLVSMQAPRVSDGNEYYWLWFATALTMLSWNSATTPVKATEDSLDSKPKNDSLVSRYLVGWNVITLWDSFVQRRAATTQCCGIAGVVSTRNHDARYVLLLHPYRLIQ